MKTIAYFSAEYAFDDLPIFAGGLGVLAVDYLMEVGKTDTPIIAVGLFYHHGFESTYQDIPEFLEPAKSNWEVVEIDGRRLLQEIRLNGQTIKYQAWTKPIGNARAYLLDCNIEENPADTRKLTAYLYDKDFTNKVLQDALLGIGGVQLLEALGYEDCLYHLNEGHSAFAIFARLTAHCRSKNHATLHELCEAVCEETVASKHTVLSGAGLYVRIDLFAEIFAEYLSGFGLEPADIFQLARDPVRLDEFSTTRLLLSFSRAHNSVSKMHAVFEKKLHPDSTFDLIPITNGINLDRWQDEKLAAAHKSGQADMFWKRHCELRGQLIKFVNHKTGSRLDSDVLTMVWARRITSYKRPLEVFENLEYLERILMNVNRPVQLIVAGKPNVEDEVGLEMARQIGEHALNSRFKGHIAYLQGYDLEVASYLVKGADLWLNTPEQGYEASGTSGMKAGSNGAVQCSVSDGWVDEVDLDKIGWELPDFNTSDKLYGYLEYEIAPMFYRRVDSDLPTQWISLMQETVDVINKGYTTRRMLSDYRAKLYRLP